MKARQLDRKYRGIAQIGEHNRKVQILENAYAKEENPTSFHEVRVEHILVDVPDDIPLREVIALASALHYYKESAEGIKAKAWASQRKNYTLDMTADMAIACGNPITTEVLTRTLNFPVFDRNDVRHPGDYDMYCRIDSDVMDSLRKMEKYHAAAAYGIVLGTEAFSLFPIPTEKIVAGVEADTSHVDILVIDDKQENYEKVWRWLGEAVPMLRVSRALDCMNNFRAMVGAINQAQLIVGPASLYTYLACCMRKPVFEIYPKDISRAWLSKWDNKLYSMYVTEDVDKDVLLKGVAYLWRRMLVSKQPQVSDMVPEQIQMEQSQLGAGSVKTS